MSKKRKGWICPNCGSGISPDVMACDCVQSDAQRLQLIKGGEETKDEEEEEEEPKTIKTWVGYQCPTCGQWVLPTMMHVHSWPGTTFTVNSPPYTRGTATKVYWSQPELWDNQSG